MALKDLSTVISNPNWKLKKLSIDFALVNADKAVVLLDSMIANLHVEHIRIKGSTLKPMVTLLSKFQPNALESINFEFDYMEKHLMERIMKMDQWKNAKRLELSSIPDWFPFENLFHFKEFTIGKIYVSDDRLLKIRDILFKSPTFEFCFFSTDSEVPLRTEGYESEEDEDLDELEDSIEKVMGEHAEYDSSNKEYSISKDHNIQICLEREYDSLRLDIAKESRHSDPIPLLDDPLGLASLS